MHVTAAQPPLFHQSPRFRNAAQKRVRWLIWPEQAASGGSPRVCGEELTTQALRRRYPCRWQPQGSTPSPGSGYRKPFDVMQSGNVTRSALSQRVTVSGSVDPERAADEPEGRGCLGHTERDRRLLVAVA